MTRAAGRRWTAGKLRWAALGAVSALGFAPWNLWPLALAASLPMLGIARAERLRGALAIGWWFGLGHFALGLDWIATAFTYQAAMPAWLGWVAVVLLSLYLAVYPAAAAGLAWRWGRGRPAAAGAAVRRRVDRHRMAARDPVHRLRVEPARRDLGAAAAGGGGGAVDRHLRPVGPRDRRRRAAAAAGRAALDRGGRGRGAGWCWRLLPSLLAPRRRRGRRRRASTSSSRTSASRTNG